MEKFNSIVNTNKIVLFSDPQSESFRKIKSILNKYNLLDLAVVKLNHKNIEVKNYLAENHSPNVRRNLKKIIFLYFYKKRKRFCSSMDTLLEIMRT